MSNFKFSNNLFLGKIELDKYKKFLQEDGFKRDRLDNTGAFGILKRISDTDFDNFKVETGGTAGTIKVSVDSLALNELGDVISKEAEDNMAIPNDNNWYWVKIKWVIKTWEVGTVDIDTSGNITGTNTLFTEALRGQPNFPSKISFPFSSVNTGEYEVTQMINDTNAVLSGNFTAETIAEYEVVGTFTPGVTPTAGDKYPFEYDNSLPFTAGLGLILDTGSYPYKPTIITDQEFIIAVVKNNAGTVTIEDRRSNIWKSKASYEASKVHTGINSLIGIEAIQYDNDYTPRDKNIIQLGWGARATNWSDSTTLRQITINELKSNFIDTNGNPVTIQKNGKFETAADFTTNNFDGWRLYYKNGNYSMITLSEKDGSGIRLTLDVLNPENYTAGDLLTIVPDTEEIEIRVRANTIDPNVEQINEGHVFNIRDGFGKIWVTVPSASAGYDIILDYRHKTLNQYTNWVVPGSDLTDGYYNESSFNVNGNLAANPGDRNQTPYTSTSLGATIELTPSVRSYHNVISNVSTGELLGVEDLVLSNATQVVDLTIGQNRRHQIIDGNSITVTQDLFINLEKIDVDSVDIEDGVRWIIQFMEPINSFGAFEIKVVTDYVSSISYTELKEYTDDINSIVGDVRYKDGYVLEFTWDIDNAVWVIKEDKAFIERGGTVYQSSIFDSSVDFDSDVDFNSFALFHNAIVKKMHTTIVGIDGSDTINVSNRDGHVIEIEDDVSSTLAILVASGGVFNGESVIVKIDDASADITIEHDATPGIGSIETPIGVDVIAKPGTYIEFMANQNAGSSGGAYWKILKSSHPLHGAWQNISTFAANWQNASGITSRYRLNSIGFLEVEGIAENTVGFSSASNIFSLSAPYLPVTDKFVSSWASDGSFAMRAVRLGIVSVGNVAITETTFAANDHVGLTDILINLD